MARSSALSRGRKAPKPSAPFTSKIIKAGALLIDTKLLLAHWDLDADVASNLQRIQQENLFAKASRSRVADILAIFRQRYLGDPHLTAALVTLVHANTPTATLDPILYFQTLQSDALLREVVIQVLGPLLGRGQREVRVADVARWLRAQVADGKTQAPWSPETTERVAQGVLSTLRDFGILEGAANKRLHQFYLAPTAFAFIAFQLATKQRSGERLVHDPLWQLFFLSHGGMERLFFEAHQERLLEYHAAGRVIRIEFPTKTLEAYARALTERTH
jgi:hypothetical protein